VRRQGWALVDQELEDGLRSIARPLRDRSGRIVAAVNLSVHASRTTIHKLQGDMLEELSKTAARIERDIARIPSA
jgi:IclR family pca regulon transcriptional regulator